jgi:hypothetical protein
MMIRMLDIVTRVPDYLDRACRVLDNRFCDAAQKKANETAVSVRTDKDQVSAVVLSLFDYCCCRISVNDLRCSPQILANESFRNFVNQCLGRAILAPHERLEISDAVGEREQIDHRKRARLGPRRPRPRFDFADNRF